MVDVEILEFSIPTGVGTVLYLPEIMTSLSLTEVYSVLYNAFSRFGLLYQVTVKEGEAGLYSYIRFYSTRSTSRARAALLRREVELPGLELAKVSGFPRSGIPNLPLPRFKCEELANYYLGFGGWRSKVLYHRREDSDELMVKYVSVVCLEFPNYGLSCEGAGLVEEAAVSDGETYLSTITKTAKRSLGEAFLAAWGKVLLVVVEGRKVQVEINTIRTDSFFYNPLWGEPQVEVNEVEYSTPEAETEAEAEDEDVLEHNTDEG